MLVRLMLIIDGSSDLAYNLNSYYSLLSNEDGAGIVQFQIPALSSGTHTAQFRVWDILNNSTDTTFTFNVVEGLKPFILDITATPSPAHQSVTFSIFHNRPELKIAVESLFMHDGTTSMASMNRSSEIIKGLYNHLGLTWKWSR